MYNYKLYVDACKERGAERGWPRLCGRAAYDITLYEYIVYLYYYYYYYYLV